MIGDADGSTAPGRSCIVPADSDGISGGCVDGIAAPAAVGISGGFVGIAGGRDSGTVGPAPVGISGGKVFGSLPTQGRV